MKVKAVIKKIKTHFKKQGIDIDVEYLGPRWTFEHNGYVGSFLANGAQSNDTEAQLEADAGNFHVRGVNDHSDLYTDYYAGSFRDNATQMIHSLLPPPAKFKAGQLVQGKSNKRATRLGYAGLTGLITGVTEHGYCYVEWMGSNAPKSQYKYHKVSYPERDLALAS